MNMLVKLSAALGADEPLSSDPAAIVRHAGHHGTRRPVNHSAHRAGPGDITYTIVGRRRRRRKQQ